MVVASKRDVEMREMGEGGAEVAELEEEGFVWVGVPYLFEHMTLDTADDEALDVVRHHVKELDYRAVDALRRLNQHMLDHPKPFPAPPDDDIFDVLLGRHPPPLLGSSSLLLCPVAVSARVRVMGTDERELAVMLGKDEVDVPPNTLFGHRDKLAADREQREGGGFVDVGGDQSVELAWEGEEGCGRARDLRDRTGGG
ncbi:hypothetical protein EHS25_002156 [Saitozyma podzolica]|uniref:Uncharacterized protein n=1 Tax=Saitozyma podzolica TaxID=1890683 RepID=A0A427YEK2_9TREE|nr:hypothetical protein EHS25_002156 [Saitozyma podzolica]